MKNTPDTQAFSAYPFSSITAQIAFERLLEKFDWIRFEPKQILVLGATTGPEVAQLQQRFPQATISVADTVVDPSHLPDSVDCIISNCYLHHIAQPETWLVHPLTWLKPGGLFLFSCYGPATLSELQTAFARIDDYPHAADFFDMHDLGDVLRKGGYENPVMDQEVLSLTYQHLTDVFQDLKNGREANRHPARRRSLMTPRQLRALIQAYEVFRNEEGRLVVSVELIYGLAWKPARMGYSKNKEGVVSIPISSVKRKG